MNEATMQSEKTEIPHEKLVIPLFEIVIYPDSRTKFPVDRATGDLLLETMAEADTAHAIGLTVKSGTRISEMTVESLYKTGNTFHISHVQPADDGYLICAQVGKRVRATSFSEKDGRFYAEYEEV
jgi:ATP-dependent Lon protease